MLDELWKKYLQGWKTLYGWFKDSIHVNIQTLANYLVGYTILAIFMSTIYFIFGGPVLGWLTIYLVMVAAISIVCWVNDV